MKVSIMNSGNDQKDKSSVLKREPSSVLPPLVSKKSKINNE